MRKHRNSGQSLVEFALIFPLALLLIIGFFDLGRGVFYYSSLSNAVREATRYAVVNKGVIDAAKGGDYNALQDKVLEYGFALQGTNNPLTKSDILITFPTDKTISIEATFTFKPITPLLADILGNPAGIDLVAQSTMRIYSHARD